MPSDFLISHVILGGHTVHTVSIGQVLGVVHHRPPRYIAVCTFFSAGNVSFCAY